MNILKHMIKLKDFYSEHPHAYHLGSAISILLYFFDPSIHQPI